MKIKIHPLFLLAGLMSALFGGLPEFVICALTALLHECGHIFYASKLGYECTKISLMPYGAAAVCDIDGISVADEVRLALAGPLVNFSLCVASAGLWWFFPVTYGYTDVIFYSNAAMFLLNILPAYPLDGGRVVRCVLSKYTGAKKAEICLRVATGAVAAGLVCIFFFAVKNYSVIAVAIFLLCSAFEKSPPSQKINFSCKKKKRGREIRYVILDENATYRDALRFLDDRKYLIFQIYGDVFLDEISEDELCKKLTERSIYDKIVPESL